MTKYEICHFPAVFGHLLLYSRGQTRGGDFAFFVFCISRISGIQATPKTQLLAKTRVIAKRQNPFRESDFQRNGQGPREIFRAPAEIDAPTLNLRNTAKIGVVTAWQEGAPFLNPTVAPLLIAVERKGCKRSTPKSNTTADSSVYRKDTGGGYRTLMGGVAEKV